ncbi:hypothetical protein Q3G72_032847 [Acer saccharum]|nr:hypothetical protein Q3G72_032847 [Acer saccharum]
MLNCQSSRAPGISSRSSGCEGEGCLTVSLSTQGTVPLDFFQGKELLVTEEKCGAVGHRTPCGVNCSGTARVQYLLEATPVEHTYGQYAKQMGFGASKTQCRRSKSNCQALLHVKRKEDGKWFVHNFVKEHNHELSLENAHYFPCHRRIATGVKHNITSLHAIGVKTSKICAALAKKYRGYENIGFMEKDMRNLFDKECRLALQPGDANAMLELFTKIWNRAVGGKNPVAILTDQDQAMKAAIAKEQANFGLATHVTEDSLQMQYASDQAFNNSHNSQGWMQNIVSSQLMEDENFLRLSGAKK